MMTLFQACLNGNEAEAVSQSKDLISKAQPAALWAIMMHAAAWHEQKEFDTPHSTIMTYATHRMIEDMGYNEEVLVESPVATRLSIPDDFRFSLQRALIERLALHLAAVDHWTREKGPKYNIDLKLESLGSSMHNYEQSVREQSHVGALKAVLKLGDRNEPIRLKRMTASLAAEDPDNLGHGFIMPFSLMTELPSPEFRLPYQAALWHLTEYLVRKVPRKAPDGYRVDTQMDKMAKSSELSKYKDLFANAAVNYGILGHNCIFSHRIAEAAKTGCLHNEAITWLLNRLKKNIGVKLLPKERLAIDAIMVSKKGTDWEQLPSGIDLPDSGKVRLWLVKNASDYWDAMMDLKADVFEKLIPSIPNKDWPIIRAAQYAMPTVNGAPQESHVTIFVQATWSLVDHGLIRNKLAALQVHRMLRQYLKEK